MLNENFIAATLATSKNLNVSTSLKDVGLIVHGFLPKRTVLQRFKKSSAKVNNMAYSRTHIYAAQADKAVVHVYSREKGNQEATIAFPERIASLTFLGDSAGFLILGTEAGQLIVWDVASGRQTISVRSHVQAVSCLASLPGSNFIISGSADSSIYVWSLPNLVSFSHADSSLSNGPPLNAPLRSFSNHRSGIAALGCGHSKLLTSFAVSASLDGSCYIWAIRDCQVLRAVLYPSPPLCFANDPADRAIYTGHADGSIHCLNLFEDGRDHALESSSTATAPKQLSSSNSWSPASADCGAAQCLTLSYDGASFLSGHSSGSILCWDVSKHRVQSQIAHLGHSVTNIFMEQPMEIASRKQSRLRVGSVVKPRLENSSSRLLRQGIASQVPSEYSLQVQIAAADTSGMERPVLQQCPSSELSTYFTPLAAAPESLLGDAMLDLSQFPNSTDPFLSSADMIPLNQKNPHSTNSSAFKSDLATDALQNRISQLELTLASYDAAVQRSRSRRLDRMKRREEFAHKKRQVYSQIVTENDALQGTGPSPEALKIAEEAMQPWLQKEEEVDMESDEIECAELPGRLNNV